MKWEIIVYIDYEIFINYSVSLIYCFLELFIIRMIDTILRLG